MLSTNNSLQITHYQAGELISPCPQEHLYVVLRGTIEVRIGDRVRLLSEGDSIPCYRPALAQTDCRLGIVNKEQYQEVLAQMPYQTLNLGRIFGMRLPVQSLVFSDLG